MSRDDAIKWLEDQAIYYETANNQAFVRPGEPKKYHRQDATAWKAAQLIREDANEIERLQAELVGRFDQTVKLARLKADNERLRVALDELIAAIVRIRSML